MKRLFFIFAFLIPSFSFSADNCEIVKDYDKNPSSIDWKKIISGSKKPFGGAVGEECFSGKSTAYINCYKKGDIIDNGDGTFNATFDVYRYKRKSDGVTVDWTNADFVEGGFGGVYNYPVVEREECGSDKPDISKGEDWCKSGYSSPVYIPSSSLQLSLGGRPVIRVKCDDPPFDDLVYYDSWEDYGLGKNPKFVEDMEEPGSGGSGSEGSGSEGSGSEGGGSGSGGENGISQTTLEDILHAINFAASNSTKAGIDAINFSNDAIAKAVRDGIDSSSVGSGGSGGEGSGSGGSGGEGSELEIPEGLLTEGYIDGLLSDFIEGSQNIDDSDLDSINVKEVDVSQLSKTYNVKLSASKQCPAPIPISFTMFGHSYNYYLTFDFLCMFAEVIGKLLLAAAYFSAAFIVARVSRR